MSAADLPERLRAGVIAFVQMGRSANAAPVTTSCLDAMHPEDLAYYVETVTRILDATEVAERGQGTPIHGVDGVVAAAEAARHLGAQGIVLVAIGQDGTLTTSTWTEKSGRPALGLAEWARSLEGHAITPVPFQTLFGWGRNGVPTRLTPEQLATLGPAGRDYAERLSFPEGEPS